MMRFVLGILLCLSILSFRENNGSYTDRQSRFVPDSIAKYDNLKILDSDDGQVRIYGWQYPQDGTMGSYGILIRYCWNDEVRFQEFTPGHEDKGLMSMMPMKLYTLGGGKYILYQYLREWSSQAYIQAATYELRSNGLKPIPLFKTPEGMKDNINTEYNIPDWYSRAGNGEGYEWLYCFNKETHTLYHPCYTKYNYLSDRYIPYIWNGQELLPGSEVANPMLHRSLSEYAYLVSLFSTARNLIRIDAMRDGSFRYAAWPASATMQDKPELVLTNGVFDKEASEWVFKSGPFSYHITQSELYVLKFGSEAGRWRKNNSLRSN